MRSAAQTMPSKFAPKDIPIEDILHYKAKGLSHQEIANLTGCDKSNVTCRLAEANIESLNNFSTYKDKAFEYLQRKVLNDITDAEVKRLNPLQRITGAAILEDKIRAIRGQATDIIEHRQLTIDLSKVCDAIRSQAQDVVEPE